MTTFEYYSSSTLRKDITVLNKLYSLLDDACLKGLTDDEIANIKVSPKRTMIQQLYYIIGKYSMYEEEDSEILDYDIRHATYFYIRNIKKQIKKELYRRA